MFCIKCGKPAVADNFCETCFMHGKHLFETNSFETRFCRQCGNFEYGPVEKQIRKNVVSKNKITSCTIKTKKVGTRILVAVTCTGYVKPLKSAVSEERKSTVMVKNRSCENCVKISGNYHEAVLQVRGEHQDRIMKTIEHMLPSESIVNIKRLKEGYDIRITDKSLASRVAGVLRGKFEVKGSFKLVGQKKGKGLFRNFYAIR